MQGVAIEVLAEPNRRRILDVLVEAERTVGEIVDRLRLTQPAVSKHLRVLREAGLVSARVDGPRRIYALRAAGLRDLDEWLEPYRRMLSASLDDLERHLDADPDATHSERSTR